MAQSSLTLDDADVDLVIQSSDLTTDAMLALAEWPSDFIEGFPQGVSQPAQDGTGSVLLPESFSSPVDNES